MQTAQEVQAQILLKVADDPEFRTRLIDDPKGVIEAETGRGVAGRHAGFRQQRH